MATVAVTKASDTTMYVDVMIDRKRQTITLVFKRLFQEKRETRKWENDGRDFESTILFVKRTLEERGWRYKVHELTSVRDLR